MRPSLNNIVTYLSLLTLPGLNNAMEIIVSNSLNPCMENSGFTANLFQVTMTPHNNSATMNINGVSAISGNVIAQLELIAYGFTAINKTVDPCDAGNQDLRGFCNMHKGALTLEANMEIPPDTLRQIPGIAYYVPDIDGVVRLQVYPKDGGPMVACLEAELSNTKSVYQKSVGWVTAIIAGLGLVASGITSGLGHTNTAAHVAANAVSLFGVFQAQAVIGMTSVNMPPIVQSWTQNFQWSMGIIRIGFLQDLARWYQRATGGTPTTYLSTLSSYSVQVEKRAIRRAVSVMADHVTRALAPRGLVSFMKRADDTTTKSIVVRGIERVGFRAGIEQTNIFMTGLIFFLAILIITTAVVAGAKSALEAMVRAQWMKPDKFLEFRNGWRIVIKGILFRLVMLGFVQMSILCLWELYERDSAGEIVLALFVFFSVSATLGWACFKVISLAKRSVVMHKNPGYILYSDPACLNKWGFLYVSYKATAYYFVCVVLGYILLKAIFIAFAQSSPIAQAVGLLLIEALFLIAVSVLRPWMDKKTNAFNISIAAINFLNSIFLLVFSNAFGQPAMVAGVMGVIFTAYNLIFMTVLLIMVLISSIYAVTSKNPETRYQPMRDDRGSFIKSQQGLTTELDALGATARGTEGKDTYGEHYGHTKEIDTSSLSSDSLHKAPLDSTRSVVQTPTGETAPAYPNEKRRSRGMYQQVNNDSSVSNFSRPGTAPSPFGRPTGGANRQAPPRSAHGGGYGPQQFRSQESGRSSPWQRGAGYE